MFLHKTKYKSNESRHVQREGNKPMVCDQRIQKFLHKKKNRFKKERKNKNSAQIVTTSNFKLIKS